VFPARSVCLPTSLPRTEFVPTTILARIFWQQKSNDNGKFQPGAVKTTYSSLLLPTTITETDIYVTTCVVFTLLFLERIQTGHMARPAKVCELSQLLNIPISQILIPCNFCTGFLTTWELLEFDYKDFHLVWKDGFCFGCCSNCAFASAYHEFTQYHQETVVGIEIEGRAAESIHNLIIRCQFCLKRLDIFEKLDNCAQHREFHKVRNRWKGVCRHCRVIE